MENLLKEINELTAVFNINATKGHVGNKAAARRARKASVFLEKLLKEYRRLSLNPDEEAL